MNKPVKLLGGKGDLEKTLEISVEKASKSAIEKIEAKKGKVIITMKAKEKTEKKSTTTKKEENNAE